MIFNKFVLNIITHIHLYIYIFLENVNMFSRHMLNIWEGTVKLFAVYSPISSGKTLTQPHLDSHCGYVLTHSEEVVL